MAKIKVSPAVVLDWLRAKCPDLHATAEVDRDWVWITEPLVDPKYKALRKELHAYGFRLCKRGHSIGTSGKVGTWGHSCTKPTPFWTTSKSTTKPVPTPETKTSSAELSAEEILAQLIA